AAFLRAIALSMKNDDLETTSRGMIKLALSQVFLQLVYLMVANTGTSDVLVGVLRTLYIMAQCFMLWQLIWFIVVSTRVPALIDKELDEEGPPAAVLGLQARRGLGRLHQPFRGSACPRTASMWLWPARSACRLPEVQRPTASRAAAMSTISFQC